MKESGRLLWLVLGLALGGAGVALYLGHHPRAWAGNDRYEDYILCTGAVAVNPRARSNSMPVFFSSRTSCHVATSITLIEPDGNWPSVAAPEA